ncbi:DUF3800 domain-containing protein [Methanobrevibacter sp. DSM 116169]|uniref:DUF3800 domain-containing protein n=1 Tax=Methanobrevibacter sp. DSM 116169 TaxID=3242727 RepID=UPI0038FCD5F2
MDYVYIDESGDLGKDSNYFVMSAILIKRDYDPLNRIIKNGRKKYPIEVKKSNELKATESSADLNKYIINALNYTESEIFTAILRKENIYKLDFDNNKNLLYDIVASEVANLINVKNPLEIRIDKSKPTEKYVNNFNRMFLESLKNKNNFPIEIYHSHSHSYKQLQVIDCIAWSYFQKYEYNNSEYINLLNLKTNCKII